MARFDTILIANRGEIAVRIARTCHALGYRTVAVYSDADADAPHVRACDQAWRLGPAPAAESYLDIEAVLAVAEASGADAVHPGFGFLAENPAFARAVEAAGLGWIGPSAEAMEVLGNKVSARSVALAAGVPVVPGSDQATLEAARAVGFPVLLKASAGGGGKGMRVVRDEASLEAAAAAARREAMKAFSDDRVFLEKFLERPRHIEVQILGDCAGRVVAIGERDCSLQRRHQKIVEECPAPGLPPELRARLHAAAVALGEHVGYRSAGTVEFLVADGAFYFLEVNTRLQVEHPVTEACFGLDLVACQLAVAAGEAVPAIAEPHGAAIEVRLYAEDARTGWLPQTGPVLDWHVPDDVRVDAGVAAGSFVGVHYDPMIAKLVAHGVDREQARRRLVRALRHTSVLGLVTNRDALVALLRQPAFVAAELHTGFLEQHPLALTDDPLAGPTAVAFELSKPAARDLAVPRGFRNSRFRDAEIQAGDRVFRWRDDRAGLQLDDRPLAVERCGPSLAVTWGGRRWSARVVEDAAGWWVATEAGLTHVHRVPSFPEPEDESVAGGCVAAMTGTVVAVSVTVGEAVAAGQALVVLEAMKMEQTLAAAEPGTVTEVRVAAGDVVDAGTVLVVVDAAVTATA